MKLTLPLSQEQIDAIGQLFFPNITRWEIYDQEKLSEGSKWNGIDIVPKGYRFFDPQFIFQCVQISLDENDSFEDSISVYDDTYGDVDLTGKPEMETLKEILK